MNPKRSAAILLLAAVLCAGCGAQNKQLTLENIRRLSQKGDALTWSDFDRYECSDVGSGMIVLRYPIDDEYTLIVGGPSREQPPMYIRLTRAQEAVELRGGDIDTFLARQSDHSSD